MHKGAQHAHSDVQSVTYHHYEDEGYPTRTSIAKCLNANGIESLTKFGASQAQSVQTQIAQHIAKQSSCGVVSLPQARADVCQRIAMQVVQEKYSYCRQDAYAYDNPFCQGRVDDTYQSHTANYDTAHYQQGPTPCTEGVEETIHLG